MTDTQTVSPWADAAAESAGPRGADIRFLGRRAPFLGLLVSGLILMVPTIGLYRFWLVTRKRRFYWGHTEIDGDALEYTGTATQLLVGFLLAVLIFLPIYGGLFYVTLRLPDYSGLAYLILVPGFFFLTGYAAYRSRRFRLTRTLWRGIRFQQSGNAWAYALRRFLWTLVTILTLGLTYPFMAKSLWAYRIEHTWFGNRQCSFDGRVRTIAWPFYGAYVLMAVLIGASGYQVYLLVEAGADENLVAVLVTGLSLVIASIGYVAWLFITTRIDSRFWSCVSLGPARLKVHISAFAIAMQHLTYVAALTGFVIVFGILSVIIVGGLSAGLDVFDLAASDDLAQIMTAGSSAFFVLIGLYLVFLGLWGVLSELVLGFGYWKIVMRGASIQTIDSVRSVRAAGIESPLAGEGLADALNVGAY